MRVRWFDYFRACLWTKLINKTTYIDRARDFIQLYFLKAINKDVHLFALGTENADTIQIKLIPLDNQDNKLYTVIRHENQG